MAYWYTSIHYGLYLPRLDMSTAADPIFRKYGVRPNQAAAAYETIREAITNGRLVQGAALNERVLAADYGFSRTPVREALTRLAGEGLVEQIPHVGAFVRKLGIDEAFELAESRRAVESGAAALAATKINDAEAKELLALAARIDAAVTPADWDVRQQAESQFHHLVVRLAHNNEILRMVDNAAIIYLTIFPEQMRKGPSLASADKIIVPHIPVAEAIASRAPALAFKAMWDHFHDLFVLLNAELSEPRASRSRRHASGHISAAGATK